MKLVVDANILIAGLLKNGITRELMLNRNINLYTSEYIFEELFNHLDEISKKAGMNKNEFKDMTEILIVESDLKNITKNEVQSFTDLANSISPDADDALYFATALKLNCAIWSNDKQLKNQKHVKVYSTHDLIKLKACF